MIFNWRKNSYFHTIRLRFMDASISAALLIKNRQLFWPLTFGARAQKVQNINVSYKPKTSCLIFSRRFLVAEQYGEPQILTRPIIQKIKEGNFS